ncbi:MAG: hypothetical protein AB1758_22065 [Candidatus Eremiobacterota bacterium]
MSDRLRVLLTLGLVLLLWQLGWADDCSTPEDAMDTIWVGPSIKGLISAVIAVAVNGRTILTQVLGGGQPRSGDQKPPMFRLEVVTQNRRTDLVPDAEEGIWVHAWVRVVNPPPGYSPLADTASIAFTEDQALHLSAPQMTGSRKAVYVRAVTPPGGEAPARATLNVSATLAGQPVAAPVTFSLGGGYRLEVTTYSEWS